MSLVRDNSWSFVPVRSPITPYGIVIETGFVSVMIFGRGAGLAGVSPTGDFDAASSALSEGAEKDGVTVALTGPWPPYTFAGTMNGER